MRSVESAVQEHLREEGIPAREPIAIPSGDIVLARGRVVAEIETYGPSRPQLRHTPPPDFRPLSQNIEETGHLRQLWIESQNCLRDSPLAAVIMMGSLLEGILSAKVFSHSDKAGIMQATRAPKDRSTGKTLPLEKWALDGFLEVANELGWIGTTAKSLGQEIRQYRNYVHPREAMKNPVKMDRAKSKEIWMSTQRLIDHLLSPPTGP